MATSMVPAVAVTMERYSYSWPSWMNNPAWAAAKNQIGCPDYKAETLNYAKDMKLKDF